MILLRLSCRIVALVHMTVLCFVKRDMFIKLTLPERLFASPADPFSTHLPSRSIMQLP